MEKKEFDQFVEMMLTKYGSYKKIAELIEGKGRPSNNESDEDMAYGWVLFDLYISSFDTTLPVKKTITKRSISLEKALLNTQKMCKYFKIPIKPNRKKYYEWLKKKGINTENERNAYFFLFFGKVIYEKNNYDEKYTQYIKENMKEPFEKMVEILVNVINKTVS